MTGCHSRGAVLGRVNRFAFVENPRNFERIRVYTLVVCARKLLFHTMPFKSHGFAETKTSFRLRASYSAAPKDYNAVSVSESAGHQLSHRGGDIRPCRGLAPVRRRHAGLPPTAHRPRRCHRSRRGDRGDAPEQPTEHRECTAATRRGAGTLRQGAFSAVNIRPFPIVRATAECDGTRPVRRTAAALAGTLAASCRPAFAMPACSSSPAAAHTRRDHDASGKNHCGAARVGCG
eukprot:SAG11_NODE_1041_length_6056_cov_5.902468_4_plen_233_part_00